MMNLTDDKEPAANDGHHTERKSTNYFHFDGENKGGVTGETLFVENLNITNRGSSSTDKDRDLNPTSVYEFDQKAVDYDLNIAPKDAGQALQQKNLIFINCEDHLLAKAAAYNLIKKNLCRDTINLRLYESFNASNRDDTEDTLTEEFSFNTLEKSLHHLEQNSVVLIDLADEGSVAEAKQFIAYFHEDLGPGYLRKVSSNLTLHSVKIICLMSDHIVAKTKINDGIFIWKVDAATELMRAYFKQNPEYIIELNDQLARQKWGKKAIENVRSSIDRGDFEHLLDAYSFKDIQPQGNPFKVALDDANPVRELNQYVLYVAAYFSKLSDRFFESVLLALLDDRETEQSSSQTQHANLHKQGHDQLQFNQEKTNDDGYSISINLKSEQRGDANANQPSQNDQSKTAKLADLWRSQRRRQSIKECRLIATSEVDGRSFISFEEPHLIDEAKAALVSHDPFCMTRYADAIIESGLIFHQSEDIANMSIELLVEKMRANPEVYDRFWLANLVMERWLFVSLAEGAQANTIDAHIAIARIIESKPRLIHRWVQLLKAIYAEPKLKNLVKEFISILLDRDEYDLAMNFIRKLAFIRGFEFIWVLKKIITKNRSKLSKSAANFLIWYSSRSIQNRNQVFKELKNWLPKPEHSGRLSAVNDFGLVIPIYYFLGRLSVENDQFIFDDEGQLIVYKSAKKTILSEEDLQRAIDLGSTDSIKVCASDELSHILACLIYPSEGLGEDRTENLIMSIGSWLLNRHVTIDDDAGYSPEDKYDIFLALVLTLLAVVFQIDRPLSASLDRQRLALFCEPLVANYPRSRLKFIQQFLKHNRQQLHDISRGEPVSTKKIEMRTIQATRQLLNLIFSIKQQRTISG